MEVPSKSSAIPRPHMTSSYVGSGPRSAMAASAEFGILPTLFLLLLLLAATRVHRAGGADPDPLQDFCVADSNANANTNGIPCLNPAAVTSSHFKTSALSATGSVNGLGFSAIFTTTSNLPGLNTQGLSLVRTDFSEGAVVPPHTHPRASEVTFVIRGHLVAGFVDTSNRLFSQSLEPGDSFVFPRGLLHFIYNSNESTAFTISSFNSQNPGVVVLPQNIFASQPGIPAPVLELGFRIDPRELQRIRRSLGG